MDTIVIGAGLAGLAAAGRLAVAGRAVTIVEARGRVGGRVWTVHDGPASVELGAEWVGEGAVHDLLAGRPGRLVEAGGRRWRRTAGRWERLEGQPGLVHQLLDRATQPGGPDRSLLDALDQCCGGPELADARARLLGYVEGFHAADPARVSLEWLTEVEKHQPAEASELRATAGLGEVVGALAGSVRGRCDLRLETIARELRWKPGEVRVTTGAGETLRAASVVVTVPLPLLGALRFEPDLPDKRAAARRLETGPVVKLVLRFSSPFWREIEPLGDMLFLYAFEQPLPVWWTAIDADAPLLTAWAGGPRAARLASSGSDLVELAAGSLAAALGLGRRDVARRLEAQYHHDWSADPFARGAYTYVGVGGSDAHQTLARPVAGTLFFAGEATCGGGYNATMEGAVRSGWRAAEEVLGLFSREWPGG